jgi:hypothetical protein
MFDLDPALAANESAYSPLRSRRCSCNAIGHAAYLALTWLDVPFKLAMSFLDALGELI